MSSEFWEKFGRKPKPPEARKTTYQIQVIDDALKPIVGALVRVGLSHQTRTDTEGMAWFRDIPWPPDVQSACAEATGHHSPGLPRQPFTCKPIGPQPDSTVLMLQRAAMVEPPTPPAPVQRRVGIVTRRGSRRFGDATGTFYPLGATFFWALRGMEQEPIRAKQQTAYFAKFGYDYQRILWHCLWSGDNAIDARKPGHEQRAAEFLDYSWSKGVRTQITIIGEDTPTADLHKFVEQVIRVVKARPESVFAFEVCNELTKDGKIPEAEGEKAAKRLMAAFPNRPVSVSAPMEGDMTAAWQRWDDSQTALGYHPNRALGSRGEGRWKHVGRPWEERAPKFCGMNQESGGPRSSVVDYMDPLHLVMQRALGIMCGWHAYVLHNAAGVFGRTDPARNRPANVWEVPGIDRIMERVRALDQILPNDLGVGGAYFAPHLTGNPMNSDNVWTDDSTPDDHGVYRDYTFVRGDGSFTKALLGIKHFVILKDTRRYDLEIIDPITHNRTTASGNTVRVDAQSKDATGLGGLIVHGKRIAA